MRLARVNSRNFKSSSEDSDPFLQFGFGVYGYFNFIKVQFFAYLVMSLLALPQILLYADAPGIRDGTWAELSIGSLSYSQSQCFQAPLVNDQILIQCPTQDLNIGQLISVGVVPIDSQSKEQCFFEKDAECSGLLNYDALKKSIEVNQNSIQLTNVQSYFNTPNSAPK